MSKLKKLVISAGTHKVTFQVTSGCMLISTFPMDMVRGELKEFEPHYMSDLELRIRFKFVKASIHEWPATLANVERDELSARVLMGNVIYSFNRLIFRSVTVVENNFRMFSSFDSDDFST